MNRLAKLALGAVMAGGIALSAVPPAEAGVSIGIGVGIPGGYYGGHPGHWCYYHPGACGGYAGPYVEGGYWAGHGYWHGGRWWGGRERWHGGWRYR
jgi:hypothetical protein